MKISDISYDELMRRFQGTGVTIRTGPFLLHLQTPLNTVTRWFRFLYADFTVVENIELPDFHVRLDQTRGIRRWVRPKVRFYLDGRAASNPMAVRLAVPMLEWGMNWCIVRYAHQYLMFHSAVVADSDKALLITAPPVTGKSTLCAALVHRGWRLLSDELALLRPQDCLIVPLARPVGLKNESIPIIRQFAKDCELSAEWRETHKGTVAYMRPPRESVLCSGKPATPRWILFLTYRAGEPADLKPVNRSRAFLRIADHSFNYSVLGARGFETLANMIEGCECYEFSYGDLDEAVEVLAQLKCTISGPRVIAAK